MNDMPKLTLQQNSSSYSRQLDSELQQIYQQLDYIHSCAHDFITQRRVWRPLVIAPES